MNQHTEGSWRIKPGEDFAGCVVESASGRMICECFEDGEPQTPVDQANAKLIATLPDLLDALRPIAAAYPDDPGASDLDNEQPVTITLGDVRRAWAALAKGQQ